VASHDVEGGLSVGNEAMNLLVVFGLVIDKRMSLDVSNDVSGVVLVELIVTPELQVELVEAVEPL
jgi:hypothetical protein